jgi:TRAP-type C4-dicarboxylate transport system permease small subunit
VIAKFIASLSIVVAAACLTVLAMKWFGSNFGVQVDADGIAAKAVYPMAIVSGLLGTVGRMLERRSEVGETGDA